MRINLLDCTLRDGGYYNNWNFDLNLINVYLEAMASLQIDFVEIGFRSLKNDGLIEFILVKGSIQNRRLIQYHLLYQYLLLEAIRFEIYLFLTI